MKLSETIKRKCSTRLCKKLASVSESDVFEVIVRAKDVNALTRPTLIRDADPEKRIELEQRQGETVLKNLATFIRALGNDSQPVRLIDTSWLTHSLLVSATPESVAQIAANDDVQSLELNAEVFLEQHSRMSN